MRNSPDPASTPVSVLCDDVDSLIQDYGSVAQCYKRLRTIFALVQDRPTPSRLIISLSSDSPLIKLLTPPSFSPSLTSIVLHSPLLVRHLAGSYLTLPPPLSPPEKFWSLFHPAAERGEGEILAFASTLSAEEEEIVRINAAQEGVMEIVTRAVASSSSKRGLERRLEGWKIVESDNSSIGSSIGNDVQIRSVPWVELASLSNISARSRSDVPAPAENDGMRKATSHESAPSSTLHSDPMASLSFNLSLTDEQHAARARVPLPYAHEGSVVFC